MPFYRYKADPNKYACVAFRGDELPFRKMFNSEKPLAPKWKPIELEVDSSQGPIGDFPALTATIPVLSEKALSILAPIIGEAAEALPVKVSAQLFYALHVTETVDALNENASQCSRFSDGPIRKVERYCFKRERMRDKHIFRLPQTRFGEILFSEKFKHEVLNANLKGLRFIPLPESD
jgi:hypothetical protein